MDIHDLCNKTVENLTEENQRLKNLLKRMYESANSFDSAYLHAIQHNGESSFTGELYEELTDVFVEVEELLGIE